MKYFTINDKISVKCWTYQQRDGFTHYADLYIDGAEVDQATVHYINRTWEAYDFETVLLKLHDRVGVFTASNPAGPLTIGESVDLYRFITDTKSRTNEDMAPFKSIAAIAKMIDMMTPDQSARNDWKARMLKAGLEHRGLVMPEDWASLAEDEKEKRLNGAINQLIN